MMSAFFVFLHAPVSQDLSLIPICLCTVAMGCTYAINIFKRVIKNTQKDNMMNWKKYLHLQILHCQTICNLNVKCFLTYNVSNHINSFTSGMSRNFIRLRYFKVFQLHIPQAVAFSFFLNAATTLKMILKHTDIR